MTAANLAQADFAYASPDTAWGSDPAILPMTLSIYADRLQLRACLRDDAEAAGFRVSEAAGIASLLEGEVRPLGEVVVLDCPEVGGAELAALARLDLRAAHTGAQLIVSTSMEALDDVFACLESSEPQILVNPGRAERVIALGRALGRVRHLRLRELGEEDRLTLLRLTEQVGQIAERLERMSGQAAPVDAPEGGSAFRFESPKRGFAGQADDGSARLVRATRPPMPDPRLVRRIIRQRQLRARYFDGDLFADPAWDMLLDLTAARAEHKRVSVTSLCIASGVPPTTALRWIGQMTDAGLFQRIEDETDRRRALIELTDKSADAMARYFAELGNMAAHMV